MVKGLVLGGELPGRVDPLGGVAAEPGDLGLGLLGAPTAGPRRLLRGLGVTSSVAHGGLGGAVERRQLGVRDWRRATVVVEAEVGQGTGLAGMGRSETAGRAGGAGRRTLVDRAGGSSSIWVVGSAVSSSAAASGHSRVDEVGDRTAADRKLAALVRAHWPEAAKRRVGWCAGSTAARGSAALRGGVEACGGGVERRVEGRIGAEGYGGRDSR